MKVYIPMTADILTAGHIKFLEEVMRPYKHKMLVIGLLTNKALKGYKKCINSYQDRKYILERLDILGVKPTVIAQNSLNFYHNLIKTGAKCIATGDGWEKKELKAIHKWVKRLRKEKEDIEKETGEKMESNLWYPDIREVKIKEERRGQKLYSTTKLKEKLCEQ